MIGIQGATKTRRTPVALGIRSLTAAQQVPTPSPLGLLARYEKNLIDRVADFNDPHQEWRRLVSELLGTSFLVLAAADGG